MINKVAKLREVLKEFAPEAEFKLISWIDKNNNPSSLYLTSPNKNSEYLNGKYFYDENSSLIHFTDWKSLRSICENGTLWLFNFKKMDDPLEYVYSRGLFDTEDNVFNALENIFSVSFCKEELLREENILSQFNQWRLYGEKGKGACIVFSLVNDPKGWESHHLSKVYYGDYTDIGSAKSDFGRLKECLIQLSQDKPRIGFDLGKFFCFHKSYLYKSEQEIRLIYDARSDRFGSLNKQYSFKGVYKYPILKSYESNDNKGVKYLKLPLNEKCFIKSEEIPKLKIDKVIIGYGYSKTEYMDKGKEIKKLCQAGLGYEPEIERSKLAVHYWGNEK